MKDIDVIPLHANKGPLSAAEQEFEQLAEISDAGRDAIQCLLTLQGYAVTNLPNVSRAASSLLTTAVVVASDALRRSGPPTTVGVNDGRLVSAMRRFDERIDCRRRQIGTRRLVSSRLRKHWPQLGLLFSVGAAALVMSHLYLLAVVVIATRVLVSLAVGPERDLPLEGAAVGTTGLSVVSRCIAGHASDMLPLLAACWVLLDGHRPIWAAALNVSLLLTLLATLFRTAALQVGVPMARLSLERVLRVGGLQLGLLATALWQANVPQEGFPILVLSSVGALAYALIEVTRGICRLREAEKQCALADRRIQLLVKRPDGISIRNAVTRPDTSLCETAVLNAI